MNPKAMKLWAGNDSPKMKYPVKKVMVGDRNWQNPRVERGSKFALLENRYRGRDVKNPQSRSRNKVKRGR